MNVLIAEDDPTMRLLLGEVLVQCGHTVQKACVDGQEAWEAWTAAPPPLMVLDWQMPRLDGLELCRRVRAAPHGDETFILLVTARDRTEDLAEVLDAGADDYMPKPLVPDRLRARLRIAERRIELSAARRRAEEELQRARFLAGIGETSLALQHEINNPLTALLAHTSLIDAGMVEPDEMPAALKTIAEQARRIADVMKRLRQIDNPQSVEYVGTSRMIDISSNREGPPR